MWQPIKTAPRDGTIVDLWHKSFGRITDTWWDDCWVSTLSGDDEISHWIPAPGPPQTQSQRTGGVMTIRKMLIFEKSKRCYYRTRMHQECTHPDRPTGDPYCISVIPMWCPLPDAPKQEKGAEIERL